MLPGGFTRGLAAGAVAMFVVLAMSRLFSNAWFGAWPLLLGMLPFFSSLATRRALLLHRLPAVLRRFAAPVLALALPALFWLKYTLSGGMPALDGTSDALQFVWLLLIGAVYGGVTIDAVAACSPEGETDLRWVGHLLLGLGAGIAAIAFAADALSLPALWLLQVAVTAVVLLPGAEIKSTESDSRKKETPSFLPAPGEILQLLLPALAAFVLPFFLRTVAEMPLVANGAPLRVAAVLAAAAGAGLLGARWWKSRFPISSPLANYSAVGGAVAAVGFALTAGQFWTGSFTDLYIAWYEGTEISLLPQLALLALSVAALAAAAAVRDAKAPARYFTPALFAALAAGLLAGLFLREQLPVHHAALFLIVPAILVALWEFVRWYQKTAASAVLLAAILLAGYLAFPKPQPVFRNYFDAPRFQITGEERTPAGRLTLLRARDYDDRFFTLFWNQTQALTQSSRAVQNDLYRMGHLPMLMVRPRAKVLMLGLGSSLPLEAITMHEPASVDCVEPMAAALRLAKTTLKTTRPWRYLERVRVHNERIPAFLARSHGEYDVIVSGEPMAVPRIDPAMLTEPYFRDASRLLADDGVFMQWLPVARMDLAAMQRVFASVLAVFPHAELWISSADPESAMIGVLASNTPLTKDQPSAAAHARLAQDPVRLFHLQQIQLDRFALVAACFGSDASGLRAITGSAEPFGLFDALEPLQQRPLQDEVADLDRLLSARSAPTRFLAGESDSIRALTGEILAARPAVLRARVAALGGDDTTTVRVLGDVLRRAPFNGEVRRVLGDVMLRQAAGYVGAGQYPSAVALLNGALQLLPLNTYMLRLYMIASFNIGDREATGLAIDGIKRIDPSHAGFRDNQATIRAQQGATDDALLLYENAITLDQTNEEFFCNMASFHYSQGRAWEAIRVLDQATMRAYYTAKPWYLKGLFYAEQGRLSFATEAYENYLDVASPIDPNRADVERRLEELRNMEAK